MAGEGAGATPSLAMSVEPIGLTLAPWPGATNATVPERPSGAACGAAACGGVAEPAEGGATPTMVPFIPPGRAAGPLRAPPGPAPGAGPVAGGGALGPGGPPLARGGFIMSIVPLNFGAAAPLRLKPHLLHVVADSEFCVPQFGQNKPHLRRDHAPQILVVTPRGRGQAYAYPPP